MKTAALIFIAVFASGSGMKLRDFMHSNSPAVDVANMDKMIAMHFPGQGSAQERPADVCYGVLGCFTMDEPWYSFDRPMPAPMSPADIETRFFLHTRDQPDSFNLSTSDTDFHAAGSDFDGSRETFFITHGFLCSSQMQFVHDMKDAILKNYDANVILVDWTKGAKVREYLQVASNIRVVAATLIKLGNYLMNQCGASASRFNVIGHSLGAQVSSYMCKGIPGVAVLYALDPAQPAFEGYDMDVRLDKTDADFVQVIHSNAKLFIPLGGLGMIKPHGHVDFYMNGGYDQPGCEQPPNIMVKSFEDLKTVHTQVIRHVTACSHERANALFTAAILNRNCTFWGHRASEMELMASIMSAGHLSRHLIAQKQCDAADSCSPLGVDTVRYPGRGVFVVSTTAQEPYCIADPESDAKMRHFRSE